MKLKINSLSKLFCLILLGLSQVQVANAAEVALIAVTGEAEKAVDPNIVKIQMEVWAKATQAKSAQESTAKEYQRIKSVVEKFKIKKEDFETLSYNLSPETNYEKGISRIVGHRASQSILITLRKIDEIGTLIDSLGATQAKPDSGGTSIQSINWDYDKRAQVQMNLLSDAVKNARDQADELAKASGTKIKRVFRMSRAAETNNYAPPGRSAKFAMAQEASLASTEMSAGPVKIQVQVNAEYELQ